MTPMEAASKSAIAALTHERDRFVEGMKVQHEIAVARVLVEWRQMETLADLVGAAETVMRRLRFAAAFHRGDEHPILEAAMLDLAGTLDAALQRLPEGRG